MPQKTVESDHGRLPRGAQVLTARPIDAAPRQLGRMGPKKAPKTTIWVIVFAVGVVAWIALELVDGALS